MEKEQETSNFKSKFKLWIKTIALIVVICFIWEQIVYAQGGSPVFITQKINGKLTQKDLDNFSIPYDIGVTRQVHKGANDETIIHIQDAHDSLTAQESIVKLLDNLLTNYNVRLVTQEGSAGYIDTSFLATFPIEDIKQKTAQHFMEQGRLSAAEFFTICSKEDIALYGIEDEELYTKDLEAFRYILQTNGSALNHIKALKDSLEALEPYIYTQEMIELTRNCVLHKDGKIAFTKHWEYISNLAKKTGVISGNYPNISLLLKAISLENTIDFNKADREKEEIVKLLSEKLDKPELEKFLLKGLSFKLGKLSKGDFYVYLKEIAERQKVDLSKFKELNSYIDYVTLYEAIDILEIFNEVASFEDAIKEKLFTKTQQKDLYNYTKFTEYLKQLFEAKLINADYNVLIKLNGGISPQQIAQFLKENYARYNLVLKSELDINAIFEKLPKALEFYELATKRNNAIINNTIQRMREKGQVVAALITGGFHTKGITELLKENKLSYLVIMPKINGKNKTRPYITVITDKKSPYEKMLETGRYQISAGMFLRNIDDLTAHALMVFSLAAAEGRDLKTFAAEWLAEIEKEKEKRRLQGDIDPKALTLVQIKAAFEEVIKEVQKQETKAKPAKAPRQQPTLDRSLPLAGADTVAEFLTQLDRLRTSIKETGVGDFINPDGSFNRDFFMRKLGAKGHGTKVDPKNAQIALAVGNLEAEIRAQITSQQVKVIPPAAPAAFEVLAKKGAKGLGKPIGSGLSFKGNQGASEIARGLIDTATGRLPVRLRSQDNLTGVIDVMQRYFRIIHIRAPSLTRDISAYNIEFREGVEHYAQIEGDTIYLDIALLRIGRKNIIPFLTFLLGHEGSHPIVGEEAAVRTQIDQERFKRWDFAHQQAVLRALEALGADKVYVKQLQALAKPAPVIPIAEATKAKAKFAAIDEQLANYREAMEAYSEALAQQKLDVALAPLERAITALEAVRQIDPDVMLVDPTNRAYYEQNRDTYLQKLEGLDREIRSALADRQNRAFIVFHSAWGYFARDYNLE
ncbi:MAG: zinc ABC transporter substrate-binding protein, partial [Candidatus Omnitrophica bacterium]|nr:zinc ABC transporter substrate-binding protein [Candidatus Omnitrophota bacterium]